VEREAFLTRLRARLAAREAVVGSAAPDGGAPAPDSSSPSDGGATPGRNRGEGSVTRDGDPTELLVTRLRELGVEVSEVATAEEARRAVELLVADRGWRGVACAPELRWEGIAERWTVDAREADFGLCEAVWAAAETGSVVVCNSPEVRRGYSLVPAAVGFFVARERVLAGVGDVLRALPTDPLVLPSCVSFVTGPSSTADLAAVHVVGVHGPGEVFVWVIGEADTRHGLGGRPPQE